MTAPDRRHAKAELAKSGRRHPPVYAKTHPESAIFASIVQTGRKAVYKPMYFGAHQHQ